MRIIHTDNFGGDYPNEKFISEIPCLNYDYAKQIADTLNRAIGPNHHRYYKVVADDYVLQPGFEP